MLLYIMTYLQQKKNKHPNLPQLNPNFTTPHPNFAPTLPQLCSSHPNFVPTKLGQSWGKVGAELLQDIDS